MEEGDAQEKQTGHKRGKDIKNIIGFGICNVKTSNGEKMEIV